MCAIVLCIYFINHNWILICRQLFTKHPYAQNYFLYLGLFLLANFLEKRLPIKKCIVLKLSIVVDMQLSKRVAINIYTNNMCSIPFSLPYGIIF